MKKRLTALVLAAVMMFSPLVSRAASFNPNHALAFMAIRFTCGCTRGGTGAMIGRYGMVTAGHNLYCSKHGKPLKTCDFYFGAQTPCCSWYHYSGKFTFWVYDTFAKGYHSENDIGYIVFKKPVGDTTGWFGYWGGSDCDLNRKYATLYNYNGNRHLQSKSVYEKVYSSRELYWGGKLSGTSGGPLVIKENGHYYIVGVSTAVDKKGNSYARRLTNNVIRDMRSNGALR